MHDTIFKLMQIQGHPLFDQALADVIAKKGDMTAPADVAGGGPITPDFPKLKKASKAEKEKSEGVGLAPADGADRARSGLQSALAAKLASLDQ